MRLICRRDNWRHRDLHHLSDGVREDPAAARREDGRQEALQGHRRLRQSDGARARCSRPVPRPQRPRLRLDSKVGSEVHTRRS